MNSYRGVLTKLERFTRKYYTRQLIQGILLFGSFGLLFWLAITSVEFVFWLDGSWRLTLFLIFIAVELFLLYRFIIVPLSYLFKIKKGLSNKEASKLIGIHFPNVEDKLFNLLELAENPTKSELLEASIEQRSQNLAVLPFQEAIDFKESIRYVRYLIMPLLILAVFWISGNIGQLLNSHNRVVNYDLAYEKPAPFTFRLLNSNLNVLDNETLTIEFAVEGDLVPENASIVFADEPLLMRRNGNRFLYSVQPPFNETEFYVSANGWNSKTYKIESISTPTLVDFIMKLNFPSYLSKIPERISGSGNAVVPEGTRIEWEIKGTSVDKIKMTTSDTIELFGLNGESFEMVKNLFKNLDYSISTSNQEVKDFESLHYSIDVIRDASPKIEVSQVLDSLNPNQSFYSGQLSDDYGISKLNLIYYQADNEQNKRKILLESVNASGHQFYYTFPSGLDIEQGKDYKLYFEVVDNDGIRGGKATRSKVFSTKVFDDNELINRELDIQDNLLKKFDKSLEGYREQQETLSKIKEKQKEGNTFDFEEKTKIKNFIQKQKEQEQLMEKFSQQLNESLKKGDENDELKRLLQERLERQELEAKKNEKLLEELDKLADKIEKEELKKRLDELSKKQSSNARNLEQLLELTKRYYVTEKASQLAKELDKLSKEQDELAEKKKEGKELKDEESVSEQENLNKSFEKLSDELNELKKDNEDLKKPLSIDVKERSQESIKQDQKDALQELQDNKEESESESGSEGSKKAKQKQKSAAQKIQELSESLQQSASAGGGSSDTEDAEMLRQILDNLVTFSFKQEQLFEWVEESDVDVSQYGKMVRDQKELKDLFEHVDDSLFSLSLRRAELSEFVNEQITEVYYNIDKSLESLAENQVFQGASYQQYVINATNSLGDFLANILDNMQQNMQAGQGQGQGGQDFQLPDIIKGQEGLQEKLDGSGQQGKTESAGEGEEKKDGEGSGKEGKNGKDANDENGEQGNGKNSNGEESGEDSIGEQEELGFNEIYEIYKEQQFLREQLEKQLKDLIRKSDKDLAKKLIRQMEDFENDLIENGITQRTRNKANAIQHQLLKLENAALKQGQRKERESETNLEKYKNPIITKPKQLIDNRSDVEILNRQTLPLRRQYDKKVKEYFRND
ncbi:DUF4175 family protein [Flagellimonas meridianipacifica]|uniref:Uncharacterized protein n=1 Tax=Flagellimonas meridianipacifica TaxID=1080225 RepID=A0A2T0MH55_9FLAO|nr:DUF4175 family protein [Allomuricauda pacifica]PRX56909.1 hypothetical protein CLV81_0910 [Allomuricauda pacifica]